MTLFKSLSNNEDCMHGGIGKWSMAEIFFCAVTAVSSDFHAIFNFTD